MGVYSEINLFKHPDGAFRPGSNVSGIIKYAVDEDTVFNKITISLKGNGRLIIRDQVNKRRDKRYIYRNSEDYLHLENVIHNEADSKPLPIGSYEVPFTFILPQNIPASLKYFRGTGRHRVKCNIKYYITIKFERPGIFNFAKKMKKEITVVTGIKPRLPMEPTICAEQKKLFQLFSRKTSVVNIKSTIESCVVPPGGKVKFNYEIFNHTNLNLKGVETKLIETYTFTTKGHRKVKVSNDIENTDSKTGSVSSGVSKTLDVVIDVPSSLGSLEYSNLVSRDYFIHVIAEIPFPHLNATLEIPLQIGDLNDPMTADIDDPPPSYWEAMGEEQKQGDDDDDDDDENSGDEKS